MSRVGKAPIPIPAGVSVTVDGRTLSVKGPKGELSREMHGGIRASVQDGEIIVTSTRVTANSSALHGLFRSLCQGMVEGVEKGFSKTLDVVGVSYQTSIEGGKRVRLQVGFSHPILLEIPKGLKVECPSPTRMVVSGCDKQLVGEFSARLRRVRPPEPYKGKGVRYFGEQVVQKAGKSFVGGEK